MYSLLWPVGAERELEADLASQEPRMAGNEESSDVAPVKDKEEPEEKLNSQQPPPDRMTDAERER